MKKYDSVKSYINRHFEPSVIELAKSNGYEVGTLLYPWDNSTRTNATLTHIDLSKRNTTFTVLTDFGNVIHLSYDAISAMYHPPKYKRELFMQRELPKYNDVAELAHNDLYYKEILKRMNTMWITYLGLQGYEITEDVDVNGWDAVHPSEVHAWRTVCTLAEHAYPDVDIEEVLDNVRES